MRIFTVTGMRTAAFMAATHSPTSIGSRIRQAPNAPLATRSLGQPQLRLISSYPASSPARAAAASSRGSLPPICSATGCSSGSKASNRARSPRRIAAAVIISVYSSTSCEKPLRKYRQ